jgi:hypothetical protein
VFRWSSHSFWNNLRLICRPKNDGMSERKLFGKMHGK